MKIVVKPNYELRKQKPYCCLPACVQMILHRRKLKTKSQDAIGYELGLIVPKEKAHFFKKVRIGEKKPKPGWGTQIAKRRYSLNRFFRNYKYPLKARHRKASKLKGNIKKFIVDNINKGNDLAINFYNKILFGEGDYGHFCLIQNIDTENGTVTIVDPAKKPNFKKVKLNKLIKALKFHEKYCKSAGFWIISEVKK